MVKIRIRSLVISPVYGNLNTDDVITCDEWFARHLVNDLGAAEYVNMAPPPAAQQPAAKPADAKRSPVAAGK